MIGSPEVDVTGITRDGERVPVLRDSTLAALAHSGSNENITKSTRRFCRGLKCTDRKTPSRVKPAFSATRCEARFSRSARKLKPSAAELVECPAGDEVQGARRQAAAARVTTHPVADLSVSLVTDPAEAHAAEDTPCPRLGHGKGSRGAVVPPGRRLVDPRLSLGLAGRAAGSRPASVAISSSPSTHSINAATLSLDQCLSVTTPSVEKRIRHGEHAPRLAQGSGGSGGARPGGAAAADNLRKGLAPSRAERATGGSATGGRGSRRKGARRRARFPRRAVKRPAAAGQD